MLILIIILLLTSFIFNYYELEKKQNYLNQEKSIYLIILVYMLNKMRSNNNEYSHIKRLIRVSLFCVFMYYFFKLNKINSHITLTNVLIFSVVIYIIYDIYVEQQEKHMATIVPTNSPSNIPKEKFSDSKIVITLEPETTTVDPKRLMEIKSTLLPEGTDTSTDSVSDERNFGSKQVENLPEEKKIVISKVHIENDSHIVNQLKESYDESKKHRENQEKELKELINISKMNVKKRKRVRVRKKKTDERFSNINNDILETQRPLLNKSNYITFERTVDM
jgi:hypothetical protein